MSKHDDNYRDLLREMPCFNESCRTQGEGLVSWHHLKCIGALRKESWSAIPSCDCCHNPTSSYPSCHNRGISPEEQKLALSETWRKVMNEHLHEFSITALMAYFATIEAEQLGEHAEWRAKGEIYFEVLIERGVI